LKTNSKPSREYWLTIDPNIYISIKENWFILFNPLTGKILEYKNEPLLTKLLKKINSPKNLLVTKVNGEMLKNPIIKRFIEELMKHFMGDMIETSLSKTKPIQPLPILKIQGDVKYLKADDSRSVGENVMEHLNELSIYLNDECTLNCTFCKSAFKQFKCCTANEKKNSVLTPDSIQKLLAGTQEHSLHQINIMGGNIFRHKKISRVISILKDHNSLKNFYVHYLNAYANPGSIKKLVFDSSRIKLLVSFPVQEAKLKDVIDRIDRSRTQRSVTYIISSEDEFLAAEDISQRLSITDVRYQPLFDGANRDFFHQLDVDREELTASGITLKEIYANQVINVMEFGRLIVRSDGNVFANLNKRSLGHLERNSIPEMIANEMNKGTSWRKIRNNIMPCKKCVFHSLCPPLGNMNIALNQNNLCSIFST
jgi:pseudo-rSAM protein